MKLTGILTAAVITLFTTTTFAGVREVANTPVPDVKAGVLMGNSQLIVETVSQSPMVYEKGDNLFISLINPTNEKVSIALKDNESNVIFAQDLGKGLAVSKGYNISELPGNCDYVVKMKVGRQIYNFQLAK